MRILEITGEPILHGGQENFIYNILENIENPDLKFDVMTPYNCENDKFRELIRSKGGKVYDLNLEFRPWKSRKLIYQPVLDFLRSQKYDVIHIHSGSISVLAYEAKAAKKAGIKKIIVHSHSTGVKGLKHTLIQTAFSPLLTTYPNVYMACSKEAGEMKFPRSVQNKVIVIKNGINIKRFERNNTRGRELREKYHIPDDAYVIGHVGRFTVEKNHSFLIDVFEKVNEAIPNSYLLLVGEGELLEEIRMKANTLKSPGNVIFTGVVDEPQDYYNAMSCFALPSLYEGFSFVTLEAQANGLPCLVSTGVPDAVIINRNIMRMELDSQKWAEYILNHIGIRDANYTNIKEIAQFDICIAAKEIEELYMGNRK